MSKCWKRVTGDKDETAELSRKNNHERFNRGIITMKHYDPQTVRIGAGMASFECVFSLGGVGKYESKHQLHNNHLGLPEELLDEHTMLLQKLVDEDYVTKFFRRAEFFEQQSLQLGYLGNTAGPFPASASNFPFSIFTLNPEPTILLKTRNRPSVVTFLPKLIESTTTMRFTPTSKGLWAFLVLSVFAILTNCSRNGEQALVLRLPHHARVLDRAAFDSAAIAPNDGHDSPAAYDFDDPDATTSFTATYPSLTAPLGGGGESSSNPASTVNGHSSTASTEPKSPEISSGPQIESTSTVAIQEPSSGNAFSSPVISTWDSSQDSASQTDAQVDETVTVTVTNFISSEPAHTETKYPSPSSDIKTSFTSSAGPNASDGEVSVITLTSLHTITLSVGRNSSTTKATTLRSATSQRNATSTFGITSSLEPTSGTTGPGPLASSRVSIITITRTEIHTDKSRTTSEATIVVTSKEAATSIIDRPTPISRIPPFSASFNLSSIPGPVISSQVSGAITSLHSSSTSAITRTVFQNITVTVGGRPETESRETEATRTKLPTYPASSNVAKTVSSTETNGTLYPLPTLTTGPLTTESTLNATAAQTPTVSISTAVVTITVFPSPSGATTSAGGTSAVTLHGSSTTTVTLSSSPATNASSSVFPKTGPTTSNTLSASGSTGGRSPSLSTASINSTVIRTLLNTTITWASTHKTRSTDLETTCEPTGTTSRSAATTGASAVDMSSSASTISNGTAAYPLPSSFRTTVSPTSSAEDSTSAYPSPSGKRLRGSPSYPWGGSGPLHGLHGPDF